MEWQPIETAPKDKTRILINSERYGVKYVSFWCSGEDFVEWYDFIVGGGPARTYSDATHWMPLPPPPNA